MKTISLLLLSFLVITGTFAQSTYSSAGKIAIFKADSMMYHHKGDSDLSIKTNIHALPPLKNEIGAFKGTSEGEIYRLKDQIIKVICMKTYPCKLGKDGVQAEKSSVFTIYYSNGKPFYVVFSHSEKIQTETVSTAYFDFYVNPGDPDYKTDYFDSQQMRTEVQQIITEMEGL